MSTYAIASAIENFSKDFTRALNKKNEIERERLLFEKEKFEFEKLNKEPLKLKFKKINESTNESTCEHEWYEYIIDFDEKRQYVACMCSKCGKSTIEQI